LTFTYVDLFSGIGGFRTALDRLGGQCVLSSEIDKFASKAYKLLYNGAPELRGDITKIDASDVPDHDLLVGGFPCQSFSVAGKRLGFEDTRGTLFFEAARIAKEKQPKVCLFENVKGLISHDSGRTLDVIISTLCSIGYTVDFNVINSKYFGVPQNRERIFIVAVRDDLVMPSEWVIQGNNVVAKGKRIIAQLDGIKTFNFDWPEQTEVNVRLRDILESNVDERYYLSEEKTAKLVANLRDKEIKILNERKDDDVNPVYTPELYHKTMNGRRIKPANDVIPALTVQDRHGIVEPSGISRTIRSGGNTSLDAKHNYLHIAEPQVSSIGNTNPSGNGMNGQVYDIDTGLAPTLTTNKGEGARITNAPHYRIRKLTPLECFRLQGFPDEYYTTLHENGVSNSQLYKMAGNAVTVNVIQAIGSRLLPYLASSSAMVSAS
jgi:DNA (cytosine-5)-methyltransferase 1